MDMNAKLRLISIILTPYLRSLKLVSILVIQLFMSWPLISLAKDERLQLKKVDFAYGSEKYRLVALQSEPWAWDEEDLSEDELKYHFYAERFLRDIQVFVENTHMKLGKNSDGPMVHRMILQSMRRRSDPLGRLSFSDAGRTSHKVDDYLERRGLILAIYRQTASLTWEMTGTLKFIVTDPERLNAPILSELSDFIPLAIGTYRRESEVIDLEYENLAKLEGTPSPVRALLKYAMASDFFREITTEKTGQVYLNSEKHLVDYHQKFGFEIDPGFFEELPANRMQNSIQSFVQSVNEYVRAEQQGLQTFLPRTQGVPVHFSGNSCHELFQSNPTFPISEI